MSNYRDRQRARLRARATGMPLIWCRLPAAHKAALRRAAIDAGVSMSEFIRQRLADVVYPRDSLISRDFQPAAPAARFTRPTDPNWLHRRQDRKARNAVAYFSEALALSQARVDEAADAVSLAPQHRKLVDRPPEE